MHIVFMTAGLHLFIDFAITVLVSCINTLYLQFVMLKYPGNLIAYVNCNFTQLLFKIKQLLSSIALLYNNIL